MLWQLLWKLLCFSSFLSIVALGGHLPFWPWYQPLFIHSCQHRLNAASYWLKYRTLFDSFNQPLSNPYFKLWHLFVICKNPSVMYCYNQRKIFTVEMQQKFLPSAWESLLISTCWIRSYDAQELSFIGHQILIVYMFGLNVFAYEISLQSDNSFLVRLFFSCLCVCLL